MAAALRVGGWNSSSAGLSSLDSQAICAHCVARVLGDSDLRTRACLSSRGDAPAKLSAHYLCKRSLCAERAAERYANQAARHSSASGFSILSEPFIIFVAAAGLDGRAK